MILDKKKGEYYFSEKIVGSDKQLLITIPKTNWKVFEVGSRAKIISQKGQELIRKVMTMSSGRQRIVFIPYQDWDLFKRGDKVKIYPIKV